MKKLFKKINKINKDIKEKELFLKITQSKDNVYYLKFNAEKERELNIKEIKIELKKLISLKYATLETLEQLINLEKADLSTLQKDLL